MDIKIYKLKKSKTLGLLIFSIFFTVFSFLFAIFATKDFLVEDFPIFENNVAFMCLKIIMVLCGFIFLFCCGFMLKKLFQSSAGLVLDYDHLIDNTSALALGKIKYSDISKVYIKDLYLCIELKNINEYLQKTNKVKKNTMMANKKLGFECVLIVDTILDAKITEVFNELVLRLKKYKEDNIDVL